MYFPMAVTTHPQVDAAVAAVLKELAPDVLKIRYQIAQDWTGDWAVFFKVMLSDRGANKRNRHRVTSRVIWLMSANLNLPELGMFPHFDFLSPTEHGKFSDSNWA
jgi:hypothetical protein